MRWIVGSSLKFRGLVIAAAAGVMFFGMMELDGTPVDTLPEFKPTVVEVQTEALGLSAEEVEQFITVPLEQDLLNGIAFLDEIESASLPGLSSVVMTFEPGTDVLDARQVVAERLTQAVAAAGLPEIAKPPQMLQPLSSTSRVSMVKLSSDELTPIETSVLARWVIVPRLQGVDGVANVAIWGFRDRQLQVLVDPKHLRDQGVTLQQVIRTTGNALEVSPLTFLEQSSPGTGGFIDTVNQRLHIFHEQAISKPAELARVPLEDEEGNAIFVKRGEPLTLADVSEVVEDHQPLIGDANCPDGDCLLLVIEKFPGANTVEVTREVDAALEAMRPGLPGMKIDTSIYRPAAYIESSFDNLGWALLIGAILLLLVLVAFFLEWRRVLISSAAIALSLVTAGLVLYLGGATVNMMILAGLVMGLVVLVDDAVIDVDHVARRAATTATEHGGAPSWRVVRDATVTMRSATLYAALLVLAVLLPFFFMEDEAGAFLPPIAVGYMLAVAASMLVAITVTPALSAMLLANAPLERGESPLVRWLRRGYDKVSERIVIRPAPAFVAFGVLLIAGIVAVPFLDTSLRPSLKERDILIQLEAQPGTSLPKMDRDTAQVLQEIESLSGIRNAGAHLGRAVMSDQLVNVNSAEVWANLDPSADYEAMIARIDDVLGRHPELSPRLLTYSDQQVGDLLQRADDEIVVRVYGEDPEILRTKSQEVADLLAVIDGVEDPRVEATAEEAAVEVKVDVERAQPFGVKPGDARRAAATLLSGITAGQLFEEQKVFDVVVWGAPEIRDNVSDVRELLIDTPGGGLVRLGDVADVRMTPKPTVINHESVASYLDVRANLAGRDIGAVAEDVERAVQSVEFPLEHHAELLGDFAEQGAAQTRVLSVTMAAAIGIFLLLQAAFNSWRLAALAFLSLPMALVGGVLGAAIAGGTISLGSIAGFVAVLAIAARGTVVLIRHYRHLERDEGEPFGPHLVIRGTRDRLAPILISALATAMLLSPLVVAGGMLGYEIVHPMAVVVLGGLITSSLLNLVVVPAVYLRYGFVSQPDTSGEELVSIEEPGVKVEG